MERETESPRTAGRARAASRAPERDEARPRASRARTPPSAPRARETASRRREASAWVAPGLRERGMRRRARASPPARRHAAG
ncbi:MAG TPA: hypothetical protein VF092_00490, partial [Longimicrobium sp.]